MVPVTETSVSTGCTFEDDSLLPSGMAGYGGIDQRSLLEHVGLIHLRSEPGSGARLLAPLFSRFFSPKKKKRDTQTAAKKLRRSKAKAASAPSSSSSVQRWRSPAEAALQSAGPEGILRTLLGASGIRMASRECSKIF